MTTMATTETQAEESPPIVDIDGELEAAGGGDEGDGKPKAKILMRPKDKKKEAEEEKDSAYMRAKGELSKELLALKTADHVATKEWIEQLASQTAIQVHVLRKEPRLFPDPRTGERKKVDGLVGKYERTIDEDEVQQNHGGGTYQLVIKVRGAKGNWQYFGARSMEIAGDPRLDDVPRSFVPPAPSSPQQPQGNPVADTILSKTFDFMAQQASRPATPQGSSSSEISNAIERAIAPFLAQIESLNRALESRDREIASIREQANKGDPFKDTLLNKMIDGDSARVLAIKTQYESEIRMLKEQQIHNEQRIRDQAERDRDRLEKAHDRELANLKASFDTQKSSIETSQTTQKMVLDSEIRRLEKQVEKLEADLVTLRNKKEQTVSEKIKEMKELKELVGGDEDDDDEEKSTIQKVIETAGQLPVIAQLVDKIGGGGQQQQAQPQVQVHQGQQGQQPQVRARPRLVRDKRTQAVFAQAPDGSMVPVMKNSPPPDGNAQAAVPAVDPAVVKQALEYMEGAYRSNTPAETFAESARPLIPESVLGAIRAYPTIDEFLSKVAQLSGTSPLATQGGRTWCRKVRKALLGEE